MVMVIHLQILGHRQEWFVLLHATGSRLQM